MRGKFNIYNVINLFDENSGLSCLRGEYLWKHDIALTFTGVLGLVANEYKRRIYESADSQA